MGYSNSVGGGNLERCHHLGRWHLMPKGINYFIMVFLNMRSSFSLAASAESFAL
jgi:hypothetical protein